MSDFLFATMDFGGNVQPILGLVRKLVANGHAVRVLADRPLRTRIESAGGKFKALPSAVEWDATNGRAVEDNFEFFDHQRYDPPVPEAVLAELERQPADALALDCMLRSAFAAGEVAGRPFAVLLHLRYGFLAQRPPDPSAWQAARARLNETRRLVGASQLAPSISESPSVQSFKASDIVLALIPRELENPGDEPPANITYVGPIFEEEPQGDWDSPWPADRSDPLVVVSLGTTYMHHETVVERVLEALERLQVRTLLTLGSGLQPGELRIPARTVVRRYVPHRTVLRHAALTITHAGMGTINAALAHGVPMVCLPFGRDQPGNADRVEALGAGRAIDRDASVEEIRAAAADTMRDERIRGGARRIAEVIAGYHDGALAISELERLATSH
jgi:MGT family glycosyltransferase